MKINVWKSTRRAFLAASCATLSLMAQAQQTYTVSV